MKQTLTFAKTQFPVLALLIGIFLSSCEKQPQVTSDKIPKDLSEVSVENIASGAIINFQVPEGEDIVSITTIYEGNDNEQKTLNFNALKSENKIHLTNLNSTHKRLVQLYTVNSSGNASEGVEVWIEPLLSAEVVYLRSVLQTLTAKALIGGTEVTFQNENEEALTIHAIFQNDEDDWEDFGNTESSLMNPTLTFEGLTIENLGFYISDALNNYSDTLIIQLTPIVEHELDKDLWEHLELPTDNPLVGYQQHNLNHLWDYKHGTTYVKNGTTYEGATTRYDLRGNNLPQHFTINLGDNQNLKLTRIRVHQFMIPVGVHPTPDVPAFDNNSFKVIEVWGSNSPDTDGSWASWTKLITGTRIKPSGSPYGTVTPQDIASAREGTDFNFPLGTEAYRYIRFKIVENWGTTQNSVQLHELTLWGVE